MNTLAEAFNVIRDELNAVEDLMQRQMQGHQPIVSDALSALLQSGGKRIRPALTLLVGKMVGADREKIIEMAAASELLHSATLVHDDLIDGSMIRRGAPTLNSKWSTSATVLSGDLLFANAAKISAEIGSPEITSYFSTLLITICTGELDQLFSDSCKPDREVYFRRIFSKTASLFEACSASPAMLVSTDKEFVEPLKTFGREFGLAFQMIDDILDFTTSQSRFGKPIGYDLRHGIITLPVICFSELYPQDSLSKKLVAGICLEPDEIEKLIEQIRSSDAIQVSVAEARNKAEIANASLSMFPDSAEKSALMAISNFTVERDF